MERLDCEVQEYAWGHPTWLPEFLGQPERSGRPHAELWMGAHPKAPSRIDGVGLDELIADDTEARLGVEVQEAFAQLPYLFKVLAIDQPLSIQSHPSLSQARAGFARENGEGIGLDEARRTYRDDNHKPEMICALVEFEGLCGFRSVEDASRMLDAVPTGALDHLRSILSSDGSDSDRLRGALDHLLRLDVSTAQALAADVRSALGTTVASPEANIAAAARALLSAADDHPDDIGLVVGLLLNHVKLDPGEALFLGAGNLHAYLSGVGVELMANSDNVIRGGFTPKHIDVDELLSVVDCTPMAVPIEVPSSPVHTFQAPVEEFSLTRVDLSAGGSVGVNGPAIVLLTEGKVELRELGVITRGQPVFVSASDPTVELVGTGLAWVAAVSDLQVVRPESSNDC